MESCLPILAKIATALTCSVTINNMASSVESILEKSEYDGILLFTGADKLVSNLQNDNVVFIDLDYELKNELDADDLEKINSNTQLSISRLVYTKSRMIVDQIGLIYKNSQKQIKQFVFISNDYRLLKFCSCKAINYFICSDEYHQQLKAEPNFNEEKYQKFRIDLLSRKKDKMMSYSSYGDLYNQVIKLYTGTSLTI